MARSGGSCATSGFLAAAYPTGDFGIDVHIETGLLGISQGGFMSVVQALLVTPLWMALVWAAHAMVVMLEWGFTIDLLDSPAARGLGGGLRRMQEEFTDPLLPAVLAGASVLAVYQGIVRRRVARTVGEVALMGAMMAGGIWVISNPSGTVGALGAWANGASLGALAVGSHGTPAVSSSGLGQDMRSLFAATVEGPWCYLEFGEVAWCRDRARLDPRVRAAGLRIAAGELALAAKGGAGRAALTHGSELIRAARTNGEFFLSLPANSPARNSITEGTSLLRAICQSSEATSCRGPTAAQAEFRTNIGTWPRVGGLLLISIGLVGVLLLLGFVGLRLLTAATFSLLFLLLTPVVVLAPAFGERGRALFQTWASHLLGAVMSKLLFALLLGVLLAVFSVIASLPEVGWWTQWLLMSAFAWAAFSHRHRALNLVGGARLAGSRPESPIPVMRGMSSRLHAPRAAVRRARASGRRIAADASVDIEKNPLGTVMASGLGGVRGTRVPAPQPSTIRRADREALVGQISRRLTLKQIQLERIRRAEGLAFVASDRRRESRLAHRATRVESEVAGEERALLAARYEAENGRPLPSTGSERSAGGNGAGVLGAGSGTTAEGRLQGRRDRSQALGVHAADWPRGPGGGPPALHGADEDTSGAERSPGTGPGGKPEPIPPWWSEPEQQSSVMRDIREVEAGRKRELGFGRE